MIRPVKTRFPSAGSRHTMPLLVLVGMLLATSAVVFWEFLIGQDFFIYTDIGGDTKDIYYPFFVSLARKLQNGDFSMWTFEFGLGETLLSRQSDIASPFTWLVAAAGEERLAYLLVVRHILKICAAGCLCYFYLDCFGFSAVTKVIAAYAYAFNGFTILWGQHYFFGAAAIYIIALLLGVEKTLRHRKFYLLFALATFYVMFHSYYMAYMSLLFAGVYTLFRLAYIYPMQEWRAAARVVGRLMGGFVIGALMSAVLFLPSAYALLSSSNRVGNGSILDALLSGGMFDFHTLATVASRLFSNNLLGTQGYFGAKNYYEAPELFLTGFVLFFFILFVLQTLFGKNGMRHKGVKLAACAAMIFLLFHPMLSVVLNGFAYPFFRYTFIVLPVFALLIAHELELIVRGELKYATLQVACAAVGSITVLSFTMYWFNFYMESAPRWMGFSIIILTGVLAFLVLLLQEKWACGWMKPVLVLGVALVIVVNVCMESRVSNHRRETISVNYSDFQKDGGNSDVKAALAYLAEKDSSFYRIDKTFCDVALFNDSLLQGYSSATAYNSVVDSSILEFAEVMCPEYIYADIQSYTVFGEVCHNPEVSALLGVKYILSASELSVSEYRLIERFGEIYLYENTLCQGIAKLYGTAVDRDEYMNRASTNYNRDELVLEDVKGKEYRGTGTGHVSFVRPSNSSVIEGTVEADTDSYLYVSIPEREGWKAYVDGVETEIIPANIAFCAIEITPGTHDILFRYNTPLLKEGAVITLLGCMCFAVCAVWEIKQRKNEKRIHGDSTV